MVGSDLIKIHHVTDEDNVHVVLKTTDSKKQTSDKKPVETKATVSTETLAGGAFFLFALFFIGAISTCFGAYCGMNCQRVE